MNSNQSQHNNRNITLWQCTHCGLYNYPVKTQCKACFYYKSQNKIISHPPIQIVSEQRGSEYSGYQSPLNMTLKRPLIAHLTVYGYIRKYKHLYIEEIIKIIYNFYLIKILNYK
eukprot:471897_1